MRPLSIIATLAVLCVPRACAIRRRAVRHSAARLDDGGTRRVSPHAATIIVADRADSAAARRLARDLAPATGFDLRVTLGGDASGNRIVFRRAAARDTIARRRRLPARREARRRHDHVVRAGRRVLRDADDSTAAAARDLPRGAASGDVSGRFPRSSIVDRPRFPGAACTSTSRGTSCRRSSSRSTSTSSRSTK